MPGQDGKQLHATNFISEWTEPIQQELLEEIQAESIYVNGIRWIFRVTNSYSMEILHIYLPQ